MLHITLYTTFTSPAQDPNLTEEEPTAAERPFIRAGWFRGPRGAVVFVYRALATVDPRDDWWLTLC